MQEHALQPWPPGSPADGIKYPFADQRVPSLPVNVGEATTDQTIIEQVLNTRRVQNEINLLLIDKIPTSGFKAVPRGSRGQTVVEQLVHMNRVRLGRFQYHLTGKRPSLPGAKEDAFKGKAAPRAFRKNAVRWMGYLISHESHRRGQILLAPKQNGTRLPETVSLQGLWGRNMHVSDPTGLK
ncbi:MAG: hypothetical protein FJ217_13600 [Ignavibacteria bacterium]|nr:hypothetical protein [Ignavibacteria bacterium]